MKQTSMVAELSWTEFEERMRANDVIILAAGMTEQHGRHNPLGVDTFIAQWCARQVAERTGALAAPVFPYGYGPEGARFPGQVTLSQGLLRKIWAGYVGCYARHGAKRFLIINGHGGNSGVLRVAAGDMFREHGALGAVTEWWSTVPRLCPELSCADHGGLHETSCMLAINESLVDMAAARPARPDVRLTENITIGILAKYKGLSITIPTDDYHMLQPGNLGISPEGANARLGRRVLDTYVDYCVGLVGELRGINIAARD
jgi:creatinine amidohydrolase